MSRFSIFCVFAVSLALVANSSNADLLDFEELGLSPGNPIPQSYGDSDVIDVTYQQVSEFGANGVTVWPDLAFWPTGYGDLVNVVYGPSGGSTQIGEIRFEATAGNQVFLATFDTGDFAPTETMLQDFRVYDADWNLLFSETLDVDDKSHHTVNPAVSSETLILQWGYAYYIGLDNISFTTGNCLLGDSNQDGTTDLLDIAPFVTLITDGQYQCESDVNEDGSVDLLDVEPFIEMLNDG